MPVGILSPESPEVLPECDLVHMENSIIPTVDVEPTIVSPPGSKRSTGEIPKLPVRGQETSEHRGLRASPPGLRVLRSQENEAVQACGAGFPMPYHLGLIEGSRSEVPPATLVQIDPLTVNRKTIPESRLPCREGPGRSILTPVSHVVSVPPVLSLRGPVSTGIEIVLLPHITPDDGEVTPPKQVIYLLRSAEVSEKHVPVVCRIPIGVAVDDSVGSIAVLPNKV